MNAPPTILKEWKGRTWWIRRVDDRDHPLRVNTASAAPSGEMAMRREDATDLAAALIEAVGWVT